LFLSFSSYNRLFYRRQTTVLGKKIKTAIERIRFHAENLLDKPKKQKHKLNRLNITVEENDALLDGLIMLFNEIDYDEQIRLLTIAPPSWGRNKIVSFFPCNRYQAEKSIQIREWFGVLHNPVDLRGNLPLNRQLAMDIIEFYEKDGVSRSSANKKDIVHVHKQPVPIRFMCMTVREAYALFVQSLEERNSNLSVGRSTFYSLRPKYIKIKTPHDVCVCVYHENCNLLIKVSLLKMNRVKTFLSFRLGINLV
jgi:hypothetical protein